MKRDSEENLRVPRRRAYTLLLVLFLFALVAGMGAVLTLYTGQLVRGDRSRSLNVELRQMIDSGAAYARMHRDDVMTGNTPVTLDATSLCHGRRSAQITLQPTLDRPGSREVIVTARVSLPRNKTRVMSARVPL